MEESSTKEQSFYSEDFQAFESRFRTSFFNSLSGFKSLHILGSFSEKKVSNLGLFNSIFHVGANPPYIGLVIRPDGPEHDTLQNIEKTGNYTLNQVSESFYEKAHLTSARYPSGVSEFEPCGLKEWISHRGFGPYVLESPIKIGLSLREMIPVKLNGTTIVIGEVMEVHLNHKNVLGPDGFLALEKEEIVSVLGLDAYYLPHKLGRLAYAKPFQEVVRIPNQE